MTIWQSVAFGTATPLCVRPKVHSTSTCRVRARASATSPITDLAVQEQTLLAACDGYVRNITRPDAKQVSDALFATEKSAKKAKVRVTDDSIRGTRWRLILAAGQKGLFKDLYFPVHVEATWGERFVNSVYLGPGKFVIEGPARWVEKTSTLEFTFCDATATLGPLKWEGKDLDKEGSTLEGRTAKKLPFFKFFYVTDELAAARGRSGGLALWYRVNE